MKKHEKSLGEIWNHTYPVDLKCKWVRSTGDLINLKEMGVFHLYHALILVWNLSIPQDYQLPPFNSCRLKLTRSKRRWMISNIYLELMNRKGQVSKDMKKVMIQIAAWVVYSQRKEAPKRLW